LGYTLLNISEPEAVSKRSYRKLWLAGSVVPVLGLCFLHWGGYLLVSRDSLPDHMDAAVVLQGSIASEKPRVAAAMALLQQGAAARVALSVPKETYWGEEITPIARQYLEKNYGSELASRVDFCETSADMNSTEQEAQALSGCIQEHGWKTIALVTSNYHSRRAGMIWRKTLPKRDPSIHLSVDGVADPEYQPRGWWRQRAYATTWLMESAKLVWALL
jgi:uncharacterized SAM-binding protein YcdF (DUF218 family)